MKKGYPVLNEPIFFAKMNTSAGLYIKIHDTTTRKDYTVNPATTAFLELCTGTHSLADIAQMLSEQESEPIQDVVKGVEEISETLQKIGLITVRKTPLNHKRQQVREVQVLHPPQFAHLELTNKCNLSCLHCANNSGEPYPDELTTSEILSLIDTLSLMGITRIVLTGGEPLLHPELHTIIEHARKAPMTVDIFTNCTLITQTHINLFKRLGVRKIATSIDSSDESVHDAFRGKKGAFRKTLRGIKLLQEAGFPIRISISAASINKNHIVNLIMYLRTLNLTDYQIVPVKLSGRGICEVVVSPEEYYHVLRDEFTYRKENCPDNLPDPPQPREGGCGIGVDEIYIKADGTILPCHGCHKDMNVGSVRDTDLIALWNHGTPLELLRTMKPEHDCICKTCQYLSFCGGCVAGAFIYEKTLRCYDPYTCASFKAYHDVFGI